MNYFANKRTNLTKKGKLQGIETPSQRRYCKNWEDFLNSSWEWKQAKKRCPPPLGSLKVSQPLSLSLSVALSPHHCSFLFSTRRYLSKKSSKEVQK